MAKLFIVVGAALILAGIALIYYPNALSWFGRLPGDIRVEREHSVFYFPITTMIIVSVVLSLITYVFRR